MVNVKAELWDWALVRITIGEKVTTHAVGLRMRHLDLEAGYVLTSPIREIDKGARLLMTQNSTYELVHAIDEYPDDDLAHWALLISHRANGVPDRIQWLRFDGSVGRSMDQAEIVATIQGMAKNASTVEIRERIEAVMEDKGHASVRSKAGPSF